MDGFGGYGEFDGHGFVGGDFAGVRRRPHPAATMTCPMHYPVRQYTVGRDGWSLQVPAEQVRPSDWVWTQDRTWRLATETYPFAQWFGTQATVGGETEVTVAPSRGTVTMAFRGYGPVETAVRIGLAVAAVLVVWEVAPVIGKAVAKKVALALL